MNKPRVYARACEENQAPILAVLRQYLTVAQTVLEIGSGSGQHAVFFTQHLPHLTWQCSDLEENLAGVRSWIEYAKRTQADAKLPAPLLLDVAARPWPVVHADCVFSANAVHIMSWEHVRQLFDYLPHITGPGAQLILYGPFNYHGEFTSESNRRFDAWLKQRDPLSGVRDFEKVDELAQQAGFSLLQDHPMPANNRTLVWRQADR